MKTYQQITEAKFGAKDIIKAFKNTSDWGSEAKDQAYIKKGNLVYIDAFYYGADKAMDSLVRSWSKGGHNYEYWMENGAKSIKIVNKFEELKATGRHKKFTKDGIVGVELKIS